MFNWRTPLIKLILLLGLVSVASLLVLAGRLAPARAVPHAAGVELTPDHNRQARPGQTLFYEHTLRNTGSTTDTLVLELASSRGWPVTLLGGDYPTGTLVLPVQLGPGMAAAVQVSLTVPAGAAGVTDTTRVTATSQLDPQVQATASDTTRVPHFVYLPRISRRWPPIPDVPVSTHIDNSDQDPYYTVNWVDAYLATGYVLEEASGPSFADARVVYQGGSLAWTTPDPGQTPGTYYYRVKARNNWGDSRWSAPQAVVVYPLFVGLNLRWDGEGYIRGSWNFDVGVHIQREGYGLTGPDTIWIHNHQWYEPNPWDFEPSTYESYYAVSSGYFQSSSSPSDPSWKWGTYWILPYDRQFSNGQPVTIDGQVFNVSGPHSGYTAFGRAVLYWRLVNRDKFLYADFGDVQQYVHPGDIVLHYEAGPTRLLLHRSVLRRDYENGHLTGDTVQYITNLTAGNSFSGMQRRLEAVAPRPAEKGAPDARRGALQEEQWRYASPQ